MSSPNAQTVKAAAQPCQPVSTVLLSRQVPGRYTLKGLPRNRLSEDQNAVLDGVYLIDPNVTATRNFYLFRDLATDDFFKRLWEVDKSIIEERRAANLFGRSQDMAIPPQQRADRDPKDIWCSIFMSTDEHIIDINNYWLPYRMELTRLFYDRLDALLWLETEWCVPPQEDFEDKSAVRRAYRIKINEPVIMLLEVALHDLHEAMTYPYGSHACSIVEGDYSAKMDLAQAMWDSITFARMPRPE